MRTFKFRVWNNKTKSWVHGPHQRPDLDGVNLFGENILMGGFMNGVSLEDMNECVALQYTGLYDKNAREIYEGDIVKMENRTHCQYAEVRYSEYDFAFKIEDRFIREFIKFNEITLVGNIFENVNLLK